MSTTSAATPPHHANAVSPGLLVYDIVTCIFTFLGTVGAALIFIHRVHNTDHWWDNWVALASLVVTLCALVGTLMISASSIYGAGYYLTTYTISELNISFKLALASDILYNSSVAGSKASIVFFYRRIFSVDHQFLRCIHIIGVVIVGSVLASVFGGIFLDNPVETQWYVGKPYTSVNARAFWTIVAVANIFMDTMILGIALVKVWKLRMSRRRKLFMSSVFFLGAL